MSSFLKFLPLLPPKKICNLPRTVNQIKLPTTSCFSQGNFYHSYINEPRIKSGCYSNSSKSEVGGRDSQITGVHWPTGPSLLDEVPGQQEAMSQTIGGDFRGRHHGLSTDL